MAEVTTEATSTTTTTTTTTEQSPSSSSSSSSTSAAASSAACSACGKPSSLKCPTCKKLGLPDSHFCTQECFKANWSKHKLLHELINLPSERQIQMPTTYAGFQFTGPLRPAMRSPKRVVPSHIPRPEYADHPTGAANAEKRAKAQHHIEVKTPKQIEGMRAASKIAKEVLDIAAAAVKEGVTTDEIDRIVHEATIARNAYPSPLNYYGFPKSCCTSVNEVICHGIPDFRPLEKGDIVNLDITAYYGGFHADVNATYFVGEVDEASKKLVNTTRECLEQAIAICKPGTLYREIGNVIQKTATKAGLSVVRTYCGHGIGEHFHTAPSIPHYGKNKAVGVMKPGHVFTIEPMINQGTWADKLWPDDWTAATRDGMRSAQFEHTLLITETGVEILTG